MMVKSQDITRLENLFKEIDTSQDGRINKAELEQFMDQFTGRTSFSENDVEEIFASIAGPNATSISYSEFITASMDKRTQLSEENLVKMRDKRMWSTIVKRPHLEVVNQRFFLRLFYGA